MEQQYAETPFEEEVLVKESVQNKRTVNSEADNTSVVSQINLDIPFEPTKAEIVDENKEEDSLSNDQPGCCTSEWIEQTFFDRKKLQFSGFSLFMAFVSMGTYAFDVVSDLLNAYSYYLNRNKIENHMIYFYLTLLCTVVPSLLMQSISLSAEMKSLLKHRRECTLKNQVYLLAVIVAHLAQLGVFYRTVRMIYFGIKGRKGDRVEYYHKKWFVEYCALIVMRMLETYLEAIPQLMLQIHIMLTTQQAPLITILSCLGSIAGLSMSMRNFDVLSEENLSEEVEDTSIHETVCYVPYQSFTMLSRVLAYALLININVWAWLGLFLAHWLLIVVFFAFADGTKHILQAIAMGYVVNFSLPVGMQNPDPKLLSGVLKLMFVILVEDCVIAVIWFTRRTGGVSILTLLKSETEQTPPLPVALTQTPPFSNSTMQQTLSFSNFSTQQLTSNFTISTPQTAHFTNFSTSTPSFSSYSSNISTSNQSLSSWTTQASFEAAGIPINIATCLFAFVPVAGILGMCFMQRFRKLHENKRLYQEVRERRKRRWKIMQQEKKRKSEAVAKVS